MPETLIYHRELLPPEVDDPALEAVLQKQLQDVAEVLKKQGFAVRIWSYRGPNCQNVSR